MRNVILAAIFASVVWAQQPSDCQAEQVAVQRYQALLKAGAIPEEDLRGSEVALATCRMNLLAQRERARKEHLAANGGPPSQPASDLPRIALPDRWWRNAAIAQYLGLTADQQKKMDDVVQQFRPRLATLSNQLKAAETVLVPLVSADPLNEEKIEAQIDATAFIRAELEKSNGRMLLGLRKLLTPEQWIKLNQAFTMSLAQ